MQLRKSGFYLLLIFITAAEFVAAQFHPATQWSPDGNAVYRSKAGGIVKTDLQTGAETEVISKVKLTGAEGKAINPASFVFSNDNKELLVFTHTAKVWRYNTRGDYWVLDLVSGKLVQLGKDKPSQSLMYAKLSPDGTKAAYVSQQNIYVEELASEKITALTTNGNRKNINGTFDWVYEEELGCRDGFQWSPDSKRISYWNIDATKIRDFYMINNTD